MLMHWIKFLLSKTVIPIFELKTPCVLLLNATLVLLLTNNRTKTEIFRGLHLSTVDKKNAPKLISNTRERKNPTAVL